MTSLNPLPLTANDFSFKPPFWLRNAHLQSTLPSTQWWRARVRKRATQLLAASQAVILDCGNGVRLSGYHAQPANSSSRWVMLLHGWLGGADSSYVLALGASLFAQGYNVFRLNLRDHGDSHELNVGLFHSCLLDEVVGAVRAVQTRFNATQLSLAGFSLGGNFALRVAARAPEAGIQLQRVIAISPAINPAATDAVLAAGHPMYRHYFMSKWKEMLQLKQQFFPDHYQLADALHSRTIPELTDLLVRRYSGFSGIDEYYRSYGLMGDTLHGLQVTSYLVAALDDPIIPAIDLMQLPRSEALNVIVTQHGGHCGFFDDLNSERWIDRKVMRLLE